MRLLFKLRIISVLIALLCFLSCKKFLDVGNPPDKVASRYVYGSSVSASSVLTGIYIDIQQGGGFACGTSGLSLIFGLAADELKAPPNSFLFNATYRNNARYDYWTPMYKFIYRVNAVIEGVSNSDLPASIREQLLGEAYFVRGFLYFNLVNIYGDVPIILVTDYKKSAVLTRARIVDVYAQIITDLTAATALLGNDYMKPDGSGSTIDRVRPNQWVAKALLARVHLYFGNWKMAADIADSVVQNVTQYDLVPLADVFLKNSREAIWQLQPSNTVTAYKNTLDAKMFVLTNGIEPFDNPVCLSDFLLQSFEKGDKRKGSWVGVDSSTGEKLFFPFKYKKYKPDEDVEEFLTVIRLSELYLILAESQAMMNNISKAKKFLNAIRKRAGLKDVEDTSKDEILNMINHERRIEFFSEWGHRWFDLKRTGKIDMVMDTISSKKGGEWYNYKKWFDIPVSELRLNRNLQQNEGYPSF